MKDLFGISKVLEAAGYDVYLTKNMKDILFNEVIVSNVHIGESLRFDNKKYVNFKAVKIGESPEKVHKIKTFSQNIVEVFELLIKAGLKEDGCIACIFFKHNSSIQIQDVSAETKDMLQKTMSLKEIDLSENMKTDIQSKTVNDELFKTALEIKEKKDKLHREEAIVYEKIDEEE